MTHCVKAAGDGIQAGITKECEAASLFHEGGVFHSLPICIEQLNLTHLHHIDLLNLHHRWQHTGSFGHWVARPHQSVVTVHKQLPLIMAISMNPIMPRSRRSSSIASGHCPFVAGGLLKVFGERSPGRLEAKSHRHCTAPHGPQTCKYNQQHDKQQGTCHTAIYKSTDVLVIDCHL